MNEVWDLTPLYKGFDDPAYEADMAAMKALVEDFTAFSKELPNMEPVAGLRRGVELYKAGAAPKLLMSGDHGTVPYNEVQSMKQYAIDESVVSSDIFMDHAGFSTYESLYRAKDIFQAKKIIIVTQEYHLYRALYIANALGIEAYGVHSDYRNYAGQSGFDLREILARNKDFLTSIFKPKPTYGGDAIPIWGNGDLTND